MELRPTGDRLIVEREKLEISKVIVDPRERDSLIAVVRAVGPEVKILKAGMKVIVRETVGHELTFDSEAGKKKYLVIEEGQVDGIVE